MFELGYTLAKKKPNIIISQSADYLPFDIRNIRTIVYSNTWSGIEELRIKIQDFLREFAPQKTSTKAKHKEEAVEEIGGSCCDSQFAADCHASLTD